MMYDKAKQELKWGITMSSSFHYGHMCDAFGIGIWIFIIEVMEVFDFIKETRKEIIHFIKVISSGIR